MLHLEDHLVRPVTLPQAEVGAEVSLEQRLLLDCGQEGLVDLLLVLCALSGNLLLGGCLTLLEESLLGALLVGLLVASKVLLAGDLGDGLRVDALDWDGGLGGDHIAGVDAAEGDTVDLEWAGDEENTLVEGLEEDHTLATETTGKEDEDGTGGEGCAGLVWVKSLAGLLEVELLVLDFLMPPHCRHFHRNISQFLQFLLPLAFVEYPYLSWGRLVLGRVVSAGLLGSGCDGPLTLLELLGDRSRHRGLDVN